jgi:hypothetical protein
LTGHDRAITSGVFYESGQYDIQVGKEKSTRGLVAALPLPNPTSPPYREAAAPQVGTPPNQLKVKVLILRGLELLVLQTRGSTIGINKGDSVSSVELFLRIRRIQRADLKIGLSFVVEPRDY